MNLTVSQGKNNSQYIGEPAIHNGDLVKRGGDWERVYGIDNQIFILIGTDAGYWGNLIEGPEAQIPGGLEELDGEAITSSFLQRHSARAERCLSPMITNGDAKSIKVESFNPEADRIEWTAEIVLSDGRKYFFDSEECCGQFVNSF